MAKTRTYSVAEAQELWEEVGDLLDKSPAVFPSHKVLGPLECIIQYPNSSEAQLFSDEYLKLIVDGILDLEVPSNDKKTNQLFVNILCAAVDIVSKDLVGSSNAVCLSCLDALASIFDKKKKYYGDDQSGGNPKVRVDMIKRFANPNSKGFHHLATKWMQDPSEFPSIETLHLLLLATTDATFVMNNQVKTANQISRAAIDHLLGLDDLTKYSTQYLYLVRHDLQRLCKKIAASSKVMSNFNDFWRSLTLKLIQSGSQEHKLLGLKEIEYLVDACRVSDAYTVKGAGIDFVNGRYNISQSAIKDGCVSAQTITYERTTDCGKKLKLQPCLMTEPGRSHCDVWYFISDAKGDVDYYFHQTPPTEHDKPPLFGWDHCTRGQHPPPTLEQSSTSISAKDDKGSLEKQLNKWILENDVYGVILMGCIDERHIQASTFLRNFMSKGTTPALNCGQLELSNSINRGASLLEPILPLLASTGPTITSQQKERTSSSSNSYFTAIKAARQRLLSAQRWKESMELALQGYLDASREVQAAQTSLLELERSHGIIDVDAHEDDEAPQAKRSKTKKS